MRKYAIKITMQTKCDIKCSSPESRFNFSTRICLYSLFYMDVKQNLGVPDQCFYLEDAI